MTDKPAGERIRGGVLFTIAALMIGSAVVRLAVTAGPVMARQMAADGPAEDAVAQERDVVPQICQEPELQRILDALRKREATLAAREDRIARREKELAATASEAEARLAELTSAREELRATIAQADAAAEDDVARLTRVYEQMKPKDAATLFEQMDPRFAAGFLARMKPEASAGIMAGMNPESAYAVSVILAGRNTSTPKGDDLAGYRALLDGADGG